MEALWSPAARCSGQRLVQEEVRRLAQTQRRGHKAARSVDEVGAGDGALQHLAVEPPEDQVVQGVYEALPVPSHLCTWAQNRTTISRLTGQIRH